MANTHDFKGEAYLSMALSVSLTKFIVLQMITGHIFLNVV